RPEVVREVSHSPSLLPGQAEQEVGERVAGGGETGQARPVCTIKGELASHGLSADGIEPDSADFPADFQVVAAGLERKMIDELECVIPEAQRASALGIAGTGET